MTQKNWIFKKKQKYDLKKNLLLHDSQNWTSFFNMTQRFFLFSVWLKDLNAFFFSMWLKELNLFYMTQRMEPFSFRSDSKNWTLFLSMWLKELNFFDMTQRIEPSFSHDSKTWPFFFKNMTFKNWNFWKYDSNNWSFLFCMTQRIEPFFSSVTQRMEPFLWIRLKELNFFFLNKLLKELNLLKITQKIEPFFLQKKIHRNKPSKFLNLTQNNVSNNWTLFEKDSKDWTLFSNMTQRVELFFFWKKTQRIELFFYMTQRIEPFFFYDSNTWTCSKKIESKNWTFFFLDAKNWTLFFFLEYDANNWTLSFLNMTQRFFLKKNLKKLNLCSDLWLKKNCNFFFPIWLKELNFCEYYTRFFQLWFKDFLKNMTHRIKLFLFWILVDSTNWTF